jgi:hypothetical protein
MTSFFTPIRASQICTHILINAKKIYRKGDENHPFASAGHKTDSNSKRERERERALKIAYLTIKKKNYRANAIDRAHPLHGKQLLSPKTKLKPSSSHNIQ